MNTETEAVLPPSLNHDSLNNEPLKPLPAGRRGILASLLALMALVAAGVALWRVFDMERAQRNAQVSTQETLSTRLEQLVHGNNQLKHDTETLRARLNDIDSVNKSVREEMLGLAERLRHIEDAVANLADRHLSGRQALALNEAEFLLQLAQERLALFQDVPAALAAYRLADSALAAMEDPTLASVRQTINAEVHMLEAVRSLEMPATLDALERLRAAVASLPLKSKKLATPVSAESGSRWLGYLSQFVHVRKDSDTTLSEFDAELVRSVIAIDLRAAEAALLARDAKAYLRAIDRVRAGLIAAFDETLSVRESIAALEQLAQTPLAPVLPELGSALKELRNLRATHALLQENQLTNTPVDGASP